MSKRRKRHTRKTRRKWSAFLKHGRAAKPKHQSPKGRTGSAHKKSRSRLSPKKLRKLEQLILGPDWSVRN